MYGPIKTVKIIKDINGKSRGYGFIEFEHKSDFKNAYKRAEKRRIDDKRIMVDYERGRTVKDFKPRRLGGGKGDTREIPYWLEKELKEIKDIYPELVVKYKKEESGEKESNEVEEGKEENGNLNRKRKRTGSDSKEKSGRNSVEIKEKVNKENGKKQKIEQSNIQNNDIIPINDLNTNMKESAETGKFNKDEGDAAVLSDSENKHKKKDKKDKKEKKEKKEKKDKKDKKDRKEKKDKKKDKKDKREKKEKREKDEPMEIGEIIEK